MGLKSFIIRPKNAYWIIPATLAFTAVIWCVYQADALTAGNNGPQTKENYSAIGTVGSISTTTDVISFSDAVTSDKGEGSGFSFDLSSADNIESADYTPLSVSDISVGDKVIVQGLKTGDAVAINRVIDLSWKGVIQPQAIASSTATSTDVSTATSTSTSTIDLNASTTDIIASSTSDAASSTTDIASSTDLVASSTVSTSTNPMASSTVDVTASTTDSTTSPTTISGSGAPAANDASTTIQTPIQDSSTTTDSSSDPQPAESASPSASDTDSSSTSP